MDEIRIGEKTYISSKRAAEVTGYAKDYVGQLCREGHIEAKMVGRGWYVFEPSIREHRFGKPAVVTHELESVEEVAHPEQEAEAFEKENDPEAETWERPTYLPEPVYTIPAIQETPKSAPQRPINALESPEYRHALEESTLTDMQRAWKEWFDQKQTSPQAEQVPDSLVESEEIEYVEEELAEDEPVSEEYVRESATEIEEFEGNAESNVEDTTEYDIPLNRIQEMQPKAILRQQSSTYAPVLFPVANPVRRDRIASTNEIHGRVIQEKVIRRNTTQARKTKTKKNTKGGAAVRATLIAVSLVSVAFAALASGVTENYTRNIAAPDQIKDLITLLAGERTVNNTK